MEYLIYVGIVQTDSINYSCINGLLGFIDAIWTQRILRNVIDIVIRNTYRNQYVGNYNMVKHLMINNICGMVSISINKTEYELCILLCRIKYYRQV